MKKLVSILLLSTAPLLLAADKGDAPRPSLVVTTPISTGIVNPLQTYVGTLYYDTQSDLASEVEGLVSHLAVQEGQIVHKGDLILQLDNDVLSANVAAAQSSYEALVADLKRQEKDLERSKALHERNAISQSGYDSIFYGTQQLQAQTEAAKNQYKALKTQLNKTHIRAPYNAVVSARNVNVGEWVGKGAPVASLVATDTLEARASVPANLIHSLRSVKRFKATIGGKDLDITLKSIVPVADAATRTFPVEFNVPKNMGLIEGMRIDVKVPTLAQTQSLMIPRDAVIKRFGQNVIFAAVDGKAMMLPVQVIGYTTDMAAIAGQGLTEGMPIVVKGNERIFPNMPVMEAPKK